MRQIICCGVIVNFAESTEFCKASVLLVQRGFGAKNHPGEWCLPGGHLEDNETIVDGTIRECFEETGIKLNPHKVELFTWEDDPKQSSKFIMMDFFCPLNEKVEISTANAEPDEIADIRWVPMNEIGSYRDKMAFPEQFNIIRRIFKTEVAYCNYV